MIVASSNSAMCSPPDTRSGLEEIRGKIDARERISNEEALWLWQHASDADLRDIASRVRARFHSAQSCTYMIMRIINYTNVCVAQCDYCAFYKLPSQEGGYVLTQEEVFAKLDELLALGGDLAAFNGGFNPHLPLDYYCDLFAAIRARYGDTLEFYALTIAEFMYLADHARLGYAEAAGRMKSAGVRWITGGGSEILTEDFRKRHSKFKYTVAQYFEAQAAIVTAGLHTTATMVIGFDETIAERINTSTGHGDFKTRPMAYLLSFAGPISHTSPRLAGSRLRRRSICATSRLAEFIWTMYREFGHRS